MSIAGDHLAESEYWKERALRAEAKLARPEGGDIIFECAKIALTVLRPDSRDWATYRQLVDGTPLGVGDLAYAWATGCNHMSTHIHDAIMEFKESSTPQMGDG